MRKNILIFNYGSGNYSSIEKTLKRFGNNINIGNSKDYLENSDIVILPGVGTFPKAMKYMEKISIIKKLKSIALKGKNIYSSSALPLGIPTGYQQRRISTL